MSAMCSAAPESSEDLRSLLAGKPVEEQLLVVERIQKCHHPSLAVGNKAKLEVREDRVSGVSAGSVGPSPSCGVRALWLLPR